MTMGLENVGDGWWRLVAGNTTESLESGFKTALDVSVDGSLVTVEAGDGQKRAVLTGDTSSGDEIVIYGKNATESAWVVAEPLRAVDSYENVVPDACTVWFDGCNTCGVARNALVDCTSNYCDEPVWPFCVSPYMRIQENEPTAAPTTASTTVSPTWAAASSSRRGAEPAVLAATFGSLLVLRSS